MSPPTYSEGGAGTEIHTHHGHTHEHHKWWFGLLWDALLVTVIGARHEKLVAVHLSEAGQVLQRGVGMETSTATSAEPLG